MGQGLRTVEDIFFIFGPFYDEVRQIGYAFLFVFLTLSFIREFLQAIEGKANYQALFTRTLLIAGAFAIYTPFFREITHGMDLLANFFMPSEDFKVQMERVFTAYKQNKDLGVMAFWKMNFLEWTLQGTYNLAYAVMRIFNWARLIFLSALYITGPIFLGVGVFLPRMTQGWIKWLFEVLSWNVVLSLFVRIMTEMNFFEVYEKAQTPALDLIAMNLLLILVIIFFVLRFSSMMISGAGGFSSAGGAVLAIGTAMAFRQATRGASAAVSGLRNRFSNKPPSSYKGTP